MIKFEIASYDNGEEITYWVEFEGFQVGHTTLIRDLARWELKQFRSFYESGYQQAIDDMRETK